ncbi:MAG: hypothetical protein V1685_05280 [Parcubacteria group bacterium]
MTQSFGETISMVSGSDDTLAGEHLSFYWLSTWVPLMLLVAGEITLVYIDLPAYVTRITEAVFFAIAALLVFRTRKRILTASCAAAYVGCIAGIIIVVFELFTDPHMWRGFNLIARPLWMAAAGFLVGGIVALVAKRLSTPRSSNTPSYPLSSLKGGDTHG